MTTPHDAAANPIAALTRRLAAGEEDAFREFHAQYFDRLHEFLLVVARGQEHEAREALQETLVRVARRARTFDDEDAFWCWLKAVARNAARDAGRKRTRCCKLLPALSAPLRQPHPPPMTTA
jgi:DNA-directed RNA polymerase specialized sigma24 family protein